MRNEVCEMRGFVGDNSVVRNTSGDATSKVYCNCRVFDSQLAPLSTIGDFSTVRASMIGEHSSIQRYGDIWGLELGRYSCIGRMCTIQETKIGSFCALADYLTIGCDDHDYKMLTTHPFWHDTSWGISADEELCRKYREKEYEPPCEIGNDVWFGAGVIVCRNVHIGDGCVVGAGAVITKDIPPYSVVVGTPGRVIKKRFSDDVIARLEKCQWWNLPLSVIMRNINLFQDGRLDEMKMAKLEDLCNGNQKT